MFADDDIPVSLGVREHVRHKRDTDRETVQDSSIRSHRRTGRRRRSASHSMASLLRLCDRYSICNGEVHVNRGQLELILQVAES